MWTLSANDMDDDAVVSTLDLLRLQKIKKMLTCTINTCCKKYACLYIYTGIFDTVYTHIPFFLSNDGACVYGTHTVYKSVYWTRTVFKYVSGTHPVYRYVPSNPQNSNSQKASRSSS